MIDGGEESSTGFSSPTAASSPHAANGVRVYLRGISAPCAHLVESQMTDSKWGASEIWNLQSGICNLESAICNLESAIWNLQSAIWNLESAICNSRFGCDRRPR